MLSTRHLARTSLVATLVLVAIGGFTRGSGSGYGCKDRWPLCEGGLLGGWFPRAEYNMVIEWTHRWTAGLVGILALGTAVTAWRNHRRQRSVVMPAFAAVATIGVQAWVGRLVVKGQLDADLVSVHLAISMAVVALLTMVVVSTRPAVAQGLPPRATDRGWTRLLGVAAIGSLALLLLGSYVHDLYISGWPLVGNKLLPNLSNGFVAVHYLHRVVAGVGFFYLGYLAIAVSKRRRPSTERLLIYGAGAAYALNVGLGAAHVFTRVGSSALVAGHLSMASLVWASLVAVTMISRTSHSMVEQTDGVSAGKQATPA